MSTMDSTSTAHGRGTGLVRADLPVTPTRLAASIHNNLYELICLQHQ
jgi:hypothetical protein